MKIYAKVLDAEYFDYRCYEDDISEDIIVDGGREFTSMNDEYLQAIKKLINDYQCYDYEVYYENSIKAYLVDMLPKKENGKRLSPVEIHLIKEALDEDNKEKTILTCLKVITGHQYKAVGIRGYCQGDYCDVYCPEETTQDAIDYLEAVYFGTGTEIEIHDENTEVFDADDIYGYRILTTKWKTEDIKKEIASYYKDAKPEDVVLYTIAKSYMVKHIEYQAE
jgi:hypothetical protein